VSAAATLTELTAPLRSDPRRAAVLLDVDGTLAPVVRDPEQASVPELVRRQLLLVTERYGFVACVSGRRAAVARRIVGLGSIPYAGNHGVELLRRGAAAAEVDPQAERWTERVHTVAAAAGEDRLRAAGVRLEDKGPIVALHWRAADDAERAERLVSEIAAKAQAAGLVIHQGKKVLELRPPVPIGKDAAVRRLLAGADVDVALYAGDDRTDVDAFDGLRALVAEGRLASAVCVGVRSDEAPPELIAQADVLVPAGDGVRALLQTLVT
jgi:trehalose 6-phosphate phosphatase